VENAHLGLATIPFDDFDHEVLTYAFARAVKDSRMVGGERTARMREGYLHPGSASGEDQVVETDSRSADLARIEDRGAIRRARRLGLVLMAASALTMSGLIVGLWALVRQMF
jgi:hypothetical protein